MWSHYELQKLTKTELKNILNQKYPKDTYIQTFTKYTKNQLVEFYFEAPPKRKKTWTQKRVRRVRARSLPRKESRIEPETKFNPDLTEVTLVAMQLAAFLAYYSVNVFTPVTEQPSYFLSN